MPKTCRQCKQVHGSTDGSAPNGCITALTTALAEHERTLSLVADAAAQRDLRTISEVLRRRYKRRKAKARAKVKATPTDLDALLAWRMRGTGKVVTAERLCTSLTVENLSYEQVPKHLYDALLGYRKLRQVARLSRATEFIGRTLFLFRHCLRCLTPFEVVLIRVTEDEEAHERNEKCPACGLIHTVSETVFETPTAPHGAKALGIGTSRGRA